MRKKSSARNRGGAVFVFGHFQIGVTPNPDVVNAIAGRISNRAENPSIIGPPTLLITAAATHDTQKKVMS